MRVSLVTTGTLCVVLGLTTDPVRADGGFFYQATDPGDLAQTRKEVVMAVYTGAADQLPRVTYVLRSRYRGAPAEFAWIVPLPATPTAVLAHPDGQLFEGLAFRTTPQITWFDFSHSAGLGCACAPAVGDGYNTRDALVDVEASGTAGIFEWTALTSTGSAALLDWLTGNGYAVSETAADILAEYIAKDWHFLAVRIAEPESVASGADGEIELPPLQFTCQTAERVYPMSISRVSSAESAEVLLYMLAEHRAAAANAPNFTIDPNDLTFNLDSGETNYAAVFVATIAAADGVAWITEAAWSEQYNLVIADWSWPDAPAEVWDLPYLTRLRTLIAREDMTFDFTLEDAATDDVVWNTLSVEPTRGVEQAASLAGPPLASAGLFVLLRYWLNSRRLRRINPRR